MARPRKNDPDHLGRTEPVRLDVDTTSKLYILARHRRMNVARVAEPLVEGWVSEEFAKIPNEAAALASAGPPPELQEPRPSSKRKRVKPEEGHLEDQTDLIKLSSWTVYRLGIIGAVRRKTADELMRPVIGVQVEAMYRDYILAECRRLRDEGATEHLN